MFTPPSFIDSLYDYRPLLKKSVLCEIPTSKIGTEIAIVGAGAAGLLLAHELLKMGLKPVIYEATNRLGGRLYTCRFNEVQSELKPFAELGAMRIPQSSHIFSHFAKKFGLQLDYKFPLPGTVHSAIYYKNHLYEFGPGIELPHKFAEIKLLWQLFVSQAIKQIHDAWQQGDIAQVSGLWQMYIDQYKNKSFYEVLRERTPISKTRQINLFGAMGIGSGGFNPVFQISFLEILRILVNGYIDNLFLITEGISQFAEKLYEYPVHTENGETSLKKINCIKFDSPVILLDYNVHTNRPIIFTKDKNNVVSSVEYESVVFTGSMCAAHLINLSTATKSGVYLLSAKVRNAIRYSPNISSSKTFICTETKFWKNIDIPRTILTDELPKAMYFLDYPHTLHGVICLSYTWGLDSLKLLAVDPKDRLVMFKRAIEPISSELNKYIVPLNNEVINIDWITQKYQNGAFKLITPGYESKQKALYFQFQSVLTPDDKGVYLAGDSVSWSGGWVEGALYTALNAAYSVAKRLGADIPKGSPLDQSQDLYRY